MTKNSVYNRKYHVENTLLDISKELNITISAENKLKILKVFENINITNPINSKRKRIISVIMRFIT